MKGIRQRRLNAIIINKFLAIHLNNFIFQVRGVLLNHNKRFKKVSSIVCSLVLIIITVCLIAVSVQIKKSEIASTGKTPETQPYVSENHITDDDFLTASGNVLVNRSGEEVVLSGVNLGGWLLQEYWMCPVKGSSDIEQWTNLETFDVLERRFGTEKTRALIKKYEDNWITEKDIKTIADMGCNVVRIPFWYKNFMTSPEGTWITENPDDNPGFKRLDWVIDAAGRYGMYVILDMHGCPGGQSEDHCSGSARQCELFDNQQYQYAMECLWVAIAQRYKNNPVVAAYDIMNEPKVFRTNVESDPRNLLYDRMIKAVRATGDNHVIAVEAIWNLDVLPVPNAMNWDNVMYELHLYGGDYSTVDAYFNSIRKYSIANKVAIYIGEYSDMKILEACRKFGFNNTSWTYKGTTFTEETWFMYYNNDIQDVDVYNDSYSSIAKKWGKPLLTENFTKNDSILQFWN